MDSVMVFVMFVSATDVAVIMTVVIALIAGEVYVTPNGMLFVRVPQLPAVNPEPEHPDCFANDQVTPSVFVSPPTAAMKLSVLGAAGGPGLSSIINIPVAELRVIEIIEDPPPQLPSNSMLTHARKIGPAIRALFIQPPKYA
jgi:hypothetical protein